MENEQTQSVFDFNIDDSASTQLAAIGKWAKIVAIISWVILGLVAIIFSFFGAVLENLMSNLLPLKYNSMMYSGVGTVIIAVVIIICVLAVLFMFLLYNFGNKLIKATANQDQQALESAFDSYKNYLIIAGIFSILGIFLSIIGLFN